jgi:outer membrane protein assembly factor BamB
MSERSRSLTVPSTLARPADRCTRWRLTTGANGGCSNSAGRLVAFDENGQRQGAVETNQEVNAAPIVVNGTVYVGDTDGTLYAIHDA